MSVLSAAFGNKVSGLEEAFEVKDVTSAPMAEAILTWFDLYFSGVKTVDEDRCQRLPYVVVNKLYKAAFSEYEAQIVGGDEFLSGILGGLAQIKKKAMQAALVGGECFLKPVLCGNWFTFSVVRRDCYLVFARDQQGRPCDIGSVERTTEGGKYYTLMERRTVGPDGRLTIQNKLFRSDTGDTPGSPVPLGAVARYAALEPIITLPEPCGLGMAYLKTPMENCVDGSDDGVSVYASAVGLIRNINRNEQQINDEFENGASRVFGSSDLMQKDERGNFHLTEKQFVSVDDDPDRVGITIFSPALREESYLARKTEYLRNIETQIGLKRGILSEVEATERTATEVTSSAGDYNLTIIDFQQMWEAGAREALSICDALGRTYKLHTGRKFDPETDVAFDWGDGVLFNRDRTWGEYKEMAASGLLKPELALAWYFNLPHETAEDLEKIRTEYMPEMERLMGGE